MTDIMLSAALDLSRRGMHVFPLHNIGSDGRCSCGRPDCASAGKHPRFTGWDEKATTDEGIIEHWWKEHPLANVGIACRPSGIVVLDIDPRHGGDDRLFDLEGKYGPLPITWEAITGSGGRHVIFKADGPPVRNQAPVADRDGTKMYGVDVRGIGGLIVGVGSTHVTGGVYTWEVSGHPDDVPLAPLPGWLSGLARGTSRTFQAAPMNPPVEERIIEGGRNNALTSLAGTFRRRGMTEQEVLGSLRVINEARCKPPLDDEEVRDIAAHVCRYAPTEPLRVNPDTGEVMDRPLTDAGNAERLIDRHGQNIRYCRKTGLWYLWNGRAWVADETGAIISLAISTARQIPIEAVQAESDHAKKVLKWALASESATKLKAMIGLAEGDARIAITPDQLDADPMLFNCENGTLDLHTGVLRPHAREDMLTKVAPATYDPQAAAPTWDAFLTRIMADSPALIGFLRRAAGYSLTGLTTESVVFIPYGNGANGKSTFTNAIMDVMGPYAKQAAPDLLIAKQQAGHTTDIVDLMGARFVASIETDEGKRLAEASLKQMTGGDKLKGRFMHKDNIEFAPTHKVWLATNHRPVIRGTDNGIWRRIRLIPFVATISDAEKDPMLGEKLKAERAGILAWMVRGCVEWLRDGLKAPATVTEATNAYRSAMDVLAEFFADRCEVDLNSTAMTVFKSDLYRAYVDWCAENGEYTVSQRQLSQRLSERGFVSDRGGVNGAHLWRGIGLRAQVAQANYAAGQHPF